MKYFILLMLFLSLAPSLHARQIIDLSTGQVTNDSVLQAPEKDVEYVGDGIVVTYKIQKAALSEDDLYTGTFNLEIPGFSNCMELRMPGIPMGGDYYIVPKDSEPTVALVSARYKDLKYELAPARWPMSMSDTVSYSKSNVPVIQPYSGFWPQVVVEELPVGMYRRQPIANAAINPVQYNYDSKTVRVYTEIKYKISFANSKSMADLEFEPGSLLNPNHKLPLKALKKLGSRIVDDIGLTSPGSSVDANAGYLIISVPEFKETLQEFVKWKKRLGYTVTELYDAAWTSDKIRASVKQQYDNDTTLMYVMLIGDHAKVPSEIFTLPSTDKSFISDINYGRSDGKESIRPDIYRGRWPVSSVDELQTVIDKTMWYEQWPPIDSRFYKRASHFSFFEDGETQSSHDGMEDGRYVRTCEDVRDYMFGNFQFDVDRFYGHYIGSNCKFMYWPTNWHNKHADGKNLPAELLHENGFDWSYGSSDLISAINDGVSYVLYRGHGSYFDWGTKEQTVFKNSDISKLNNINRLPLIFSLTCNTGAFDKQKCMMRQFLTRSNGGAIAAFANTDVAYSSHGDMETTLFFNALWPALSVFNMIGDGIDVSNYVEESKIFSTGTRNQLGQSLDYTLYGLPINNNSIYMIGNIYSIQILHLFGDPSMYFRTEQPEVLDDYIEVTRIEGGDGLRVCLKDGKKAYIAFYDPIDNKVVRKYGDEASYFTEDLGGAKYVDVTVYTPNCIPYMDLGESYYGIIEENPSNTTRFLGYSNIGGSVMIDYYMSSSAAKQGVEIWIQDVITGQIEASWPLSRDGVCDRKASIGMRCSSGVKVAYMVVGGVPQSETMKMFVSQ
jgi:peptidase C25 gingipain